MPPKTTLPLEIQVEVQKLIDEFNRTNLKEFYFALERLFFKQGKARLLSAILKASFFTWIEQIEAGLCQFAASPGTGRWTIGQFAIFKYSSEKYDPEEWFFPGGEFVDGTVTGAMKAGMKAYEI